MDNEPCRIVASDPRVPRWAHEEAFLNSCEMGHTEKVQVLLHFVPKMVLLSGMSTAADQEFWDIVELLLEEPNIKPWHMSVGPSIFLKAIEHDEWNLAQKLLEHPTYHGQWARDILSHVPD